MWGFRGRPSAASPGATAAEAAATETTAPDSAAADATGAPGPGRRAGPGGRAGRHDDALALLQAAGDLRRVIALQAGQPGDRSLLLAIHPHPRARAALATPRRRGNVPDPVALAGHDAG